MSLTLRFWGVRGTLPVPNRAMAGIGGNTPCVEITLPSGEVLIIDCGTGARDAGKSLQNRAPKPAGIHLFFSHFHWDHIQGLPFFAPLFHKDFSISFYSRLPPRRVASILRTEFAKPYFPVSFEELPAERHFVQISDQPIQLGEAEISSFPLSHPDGAWGYRVEADGRSIVYACDHEHGDVACDQSLRHATLRADILIYDAHYTPREHSRHRGWGHSTWLEGVRLAKESEVKSLILFHHSPDRDDRNVGRIVNQARKLFCSTLAAHEGLVLKLKRK